MMAGALGLLPDPKQEVMTGRMRFCESLAFAFATMASKVDLGSIETFLGSIASRHEDVESIGLRRADGPLLVDIGEHNATWTALAGDESTETQIVVPVNAAHEPWGTIEVRFKEYRFMGLLGDYLSRDLALVLFFGGSLSLAFNFYLRRVLKQLNPSNVIPSRVRDAFDSLAEGILVLDASERVVLANQAFETASGKTTEELLGHNVSTLPFKYKDEAQAESFPWQETRISRASVRGRLLGLGNQETTFSVSSAPILNEKGESRGILASFEDVTQLEKKKNELGELVKHLHRSSAEIQRQNQELEQLANHDPLTGCRNRRSFFDEFEALWINARRLRIPMAAIMVDIDYFKSINDTYGHSCGDNVLRQVAATLKEAVRDSDVLCRYGGEEFAIVLMNTGLDEASVLGERIRTAIAGTQVAKISVTASLGVSALSESPTDPQELLDQADKCLYAAKENGRNQVVRWDRLATRTEAGHTSAQAGWDRGKSLKPSSVTIPFHAVSALVSALSYRDQKTAAHSRRVADLCVAVAEGLLSLKDAYTLEMAALLHDIGKIGVPDAILHKPGALTEAEWEVMKTNTRIGYEIVHSSFASPELTKLVRGYQTRFDSDSAKNANGDSNIPVGARILAIADAYDSMTSDQGYRHALPAKVAAAELRKNAGTQFDPHLVERFLNVVTELEQNVRSTGQSQSAELALSIGEQIESLVAALDSQDLEDMSTLAGRLKNTATVLSAHEISAKASELEQALKGHEDFVGAIQTATELLDLCRATQGALLDRRTSLIAEITEY